MTAEKLLRDQVADEISDGQTIRLGRLVNRVGSNETAPVRLSTTTVGLPGMYLPKWRPMIREYVSKPPPAGNPPQFGSFSLHRNPEHRKDARNSTLRSEQ